MGRMCLPLLKPAKVYICESEIVDTSSLRTRWVGWRKKERDEREVSPAGDGLAWRHWQKESGVRNVEILLDHI